MCLSSHFRAADVARSKSGTQLALMAVVNDLKDDRTRHHSLDPVLAPGWIGLFPRVSGRTFRVAIHASVDADTRRGIELAAQEVDRTAQVLGASIEVNNGGVAATGVAGIVIGSDVGPLGPRVPAVSIAADGGAGCSSVFSVAPPADARRAMLAAWRTTHPDVAGDLELVEWHPALTAHGAAELNERFLKVYHYSMRAPAWRGYFAIKALAETALRRATASDRCRALLEAELDGHKGARLVFDRATRVLRQPMYVVHRRSGEDELLGEIR